MFTYLGMEGEKVIESLDCLWFFSNVMHAPKIQPIEVHSTREDPKVEDDEKVKTPSEPIVILEIKRDVSSFSYTGCQGQLAHTSTNVSGSRSRNEKEQSEERKIRKVSKKRNKKDGNVGDYEEELGFDLSEILMMIEGYERFNNKKYGKMMPPLSDGMAMKQHLKSWAYAVACNVR